jgi:diguanylate cyclase (GGDEF)-like protein
MSYAPRARRRSWRRPPLWVAGVALAIFLIGRLDASTVYEVDLSLFYVAAVGAAGWWLGRRYSTIAAVLAAAAWTFAELGRHPAAEARFSYWNGLTRLGLFLLAGLAMARVRADARRLKRSKGVLEEEILLARTDLPTGLLNARGFLEQIDRELHDPRRTGLSFCLACIDIEGLGRFRDRHDPAANDDLVRSVAGVLRRAIRASDTPARLDRDEFAVAFRDVERDVVEKTLRRVIAGIAALGAEDPLAPVSAIVGLACFARPPEDPREALRQAEKALHEAHAAEEALLVQEPEAERHGSVPVTDTA